MHYFSKVANSLIGKILKFLPDSRPVSTTLMPELTTDKGGRFCKSAGFYFFVLSEGFSK